MENLPMRNSVSWIFRERIESILRRCTRLMRKATGGSRDIAPCGRKKSSRRWNGIPIWSILRYRQVRMYCSSACQIWWQMRFIRRAEPGKILWPQFFRGIRHLLEQAGNLVVVTNEVFSDGITYDPETEKYLEKLGVINGQMAQLADAVTEVVYGIPISHKKTGEERKNEEVLS